jgi:hypothetical protein
MNVTRIKPLAAVAGFAAIGVALVVNLGSTAAAHDVAGGSGDSSTVGEYTSPTITAMSIDPSAMNLGATATAGPPKATPATAEATPSLKASAAPECVNNGQCP